MYICFLLIKGDGCVFTTTQHFHLCRITNENIKKAQQLKSDDSNQADMVSLLPDLDDDMDDIQVREDREEDDPSNFFVRKYRLLARFCLANSQLLTLSYLHKCFNAPPDFLGHLPNIYITQRVLRL
ncbi:MAG: hypothetical protein J7623_22495 [Chitinophaga sp.]|nr:hypothetical protein [Chitinophaga sp.]